MLAALPVDSETGSAEFPGQRIGFEVASVGKVPGVADPRRALQLVVATALVAEPDIDEAGLLVVVLVRTVVSAPLVHRG